MHTTAKFWRNTLTALLRERYPGEQMEVAHRIDRETSGVLLIARDRGGGELPHAGVRAPQRQQDLPGAVQGRTRPSEGRSTCRSSCSTRTSRVDDGRRPTATNPGCRPSPASRSLRRFARHALCEARPETGRQHQIRVHLAALGHPIVGDKLYGASEKLFMRACDEGVTPELLALFDGLPRHALHAHRLTFPHPVTRAPITVESPWPPDLAAYAAGLPEPRE